MTERLETLFIFPFLAASLLSYLATRLIIPLMWKWRIVDDPKKNKHPKVTHSVATPRGGGVALYLAIIGISLWLLPFDQHMRGIIGGATVLVVMGFLDDKYNLNPYIRLAFQFFAASIPIMSGIGVAFISSPLGGILDLSNPQIHFTLWGQDHSIWILSDLFALFWIVTLVNFLNMGAKGLPGQLTGITTIAATVIAFLSLRFSADITEWPVIILASIVAGTFFGALPWHMYPQRIMPSFSGSNLAGYYLAILSILTTAKIGTLGLVLGVPLIDTTYTIVRRVLAGKSPVWGDRSHLHHKLLDGGWSKEAVTYFYWLVTSLLGIVALNLNAQSKLYTMVGVALILGGFLIWLTQRQKH